MNRREATRTLIAVAIAPLTANAQTTGKVYRIGFLGLSSAAEYARNLDAFLQALHELGYEDGRNIVIDYRWAELHEERLPELAAQLARRNPDLIVAHAIGVRAVQQTTSTIPIVIGAIADPVGSGLIRSLAKPGGNTTGVASQLTDLSSKRLELLKEAVPALSEVAVLSNLTQPGLRQGLEETETAARRLGVRVRSYRLKADTADLEPVLSDILRDRPNGLVVQPDPVASRHGAAIAAFATGHRLPAMGGDRQFTVDGGLMSYGGSFVDGWRLAAHYVDKILKGAKPAELPVQQPTRFELVVNQKTARAIGISIPQHLLLRATEVIQ